jgi:hypothetical protein
MADTNIFRKTVSSLYPGKTYYFQFRWKYADGTYGDWSATKTEIAAGILQVEAPTLATGLTAAPASFGVTVDWDGTYASSTFLGFKAINIYASTSNLGSSTTTNLTANLVGTMTVDQVKNRITIGSTLLKNVLSLTSSSVYITDMYFYFITINETNEVYKSGGVATYTRINSSAIRPAQANKIDLENGTISIENLVAGNGQFTEYLRAGIRAGDGSGARIEISGSSSNITSTNGGTILPGLTIYDSAGGQSLRAPLSGGLTITGTITGSTITGSSITSTGIGQFNGTLTINGGYIAHTTGVWLDTPDFQVGTFSGSVGYFSLSSAGSAYLGNTNASNLAFRINQSSAGFTVFKGIQIQSFDNSYYSQASYNTRSEASGGINSSIAFKTVVVGDYGHLMHGRALYYGSAGTSAAIESATSATSTIGDIFFSTS